MTNDFGCLTTARKIPRCCVVSTHGARLVFGVLLALAVCGATVAPAMTITFQEGVGGYSGTRDTFLYSPGPGGNQGTSPDLAAFEVSPTPTNSARSLIGFDLSSLAPGTIVNSATLTLVQDAGDGALGVINSLYVVDSSDKSWTASGATWNDLNSTGPVAWAGGPGLVAGTDYDATAAVAAAASPASVQGNNLELSMPLSLTAAGVTAIQGWINNPSDNSGFFLRQPDNSNSIDTFFSSRASDSSLRPMLTLDVTIVPEPASWVLFGLSGVGLLLAARRRRKM